MVLLRRFNTRLNTFFFLSGGTDFFLNFSETPVSTVNTQFHVSDFFEPLVLYSERRPFFD